MSRELEESLEEARAERPPKKENLKGFIPAPVSSLPSPKLPLRAGALQSSPGLHFSLGVSLHPQASRAPSTSTAAIKNPLLGEEGLPWPGLELQHHQKHPQAPWKRGHQIPAPRALCPKPAFAQPLLSPPHRAHGAEQEQSFPRTSATAEGIPFPWDGFPGKASGTAIKPRDSQLLLHLCPQDSPAIPEWFG